MLVGFLLLEHADLGEVLFDHFADFRDQAGDVLAALLEVAPAGVEHAVQFLDQEGDVAALAEHGGHDARERDDPLEVLHVLGVDEDLERAAVLLRRAFVHHDVVDGDVERMLGDGRLDLVGVADELVGARQRFTHLHDLRDCRCGFGLDFVGQAVAGDFLFDLDCHCVLLCRHASARWHPVIFRLDSSFRWNDGITF